VVGDGSPKRLWHRVVPDAVRRRYALQFAVVLAGVTVAIAAIGGATTMAVGSAVGDETRNDLVADADRQAASLDAWMTRMTVQMAAVSQSTALRSGDASDRDRYLWTVVRRDADISGAYYVDTDAHEILAGTGNARVTAAEAVTAFAGRSEYADAASATAVRDRVTVSEPTRLDSGGVPVVLFVVSVIDRPDRAVVMVADLRRVSERHLGTGDGADVVVTNESGTVVLAEDPTLLLSDDRVATAGFEGGSGHQRTTVGNTSMLVGHAALRSHGWTVSTRVPASEAFALRETVLLGMSGVLLAVVGGALIIGATVGRGTVRSVTRLSEHARRLRDGRLDDPVCSDRVDEFGELFESFDVMRRSLRERVREAEAAERRATAARHEAEQAREASEAFSERLVATAEDYGDVMAACASGDLDRRIDAEPDSEAMRAIARSFNEMMDAVQRQNERLETVSSVLSHDLRNPLTVAKGRAELVAEESSESPHVDPIVDALERMDAIVEDALVLARGTTVADSRPVDVASRARAAWRRVDTGGASLRLDVDDADRVVADPDLLDHVFENLFRNAVEHGTASESASTTDGGAGDDTEATVAVTVRSTPTGFVVDDDGPGIPSDRRESVFEAGYTTNRAGGGTGFGLAIVARVASLHGWDASVDQSPSGGARFRFDGVERRPAAAADDPSTDDGRTPE
jgi:methyl-accepting chemotaxis protein